MIRATSSPPSVELDLHQPADGAYVVPVLGQRALGAGGGHLQDVLALAHRVASRRASRRARGSARRRVQLGHPSSESTTTRSTRLRPAGVTSISSRSRSLRADERFQQSSQPLALGGAHPGDSSAACAVVGRSRVRSKGIRSRRGAADPVAAAGGARVRSPAVITDGGPGTVHACPRQWRSTRSPRPRRPRRRPSRRRALPAGPRRRSLLAGGRPGAAAAADRLLRAPTRDSTDHRRQRVRRRRGHARARRRDSGGSLARYDAVARRALRRSARAAAPAAGGGGGTREAFGARRRRPRRVRDSRRRTARRRPLRPPQVPAGREGRPRRARRRPSGTLADRRTKALLDAPPRAGPAAGLGRGGRRGACVSADGGR